MRRTAVHEAGHAVFAMLTQTPFHYVILKPNGAGHVLHKDEDPDVPLRHQSRIELLCDIIVAFAGEMAERAVLGDCVESGIAKDREMVKDALRDLAHSTAHQRRIERRCRKAVKEWSNNPVICEAIEAVADALERKSKLTSTEVERLIPATAARAYQEFPDVDIT